MIKAKEAITLLRSIGYPLESEHDLVKLAEPDIYEREIIVGAEVRAYWQVAYKVA